MMIADNLLEIIGICKILFRKDRETILPPLLAIYTYIPITFPATKTTTTTKTENNNSNKQTLVNVARLLRQLRKTFMGKTSVKRN